MVYMVFAVLSGIMVLLYSMCYPTERWSTVLSVLTSVRVTVVDTNWCETTEVLKKSVLLTWSLFINFNK